jgi:hypothetical protein
LAETSTTIESTPYTGTHRLNFTDIATPESGKKYFNVELEGAQLDASSLVEIPNDLDVSGEVASVDSLGVSCTFRSSLHS